ISMSYLFLSCTEQELKNNGLLEIKKAVETVAQHLGISRASAYLYVKET
ncbi:TPA: helix-turn-helix domain-containing protein, partial [Acinetobacter baumannii]|nr:helix-turn-helix domain-containing protein [Acinetobacter baumannii]HCW4549305.1 helix-turn-helix domain-containing protein [Acinetobacter baumannii]HCW4578192.1 helix-turn-helix domain-containing protein [Acinetobacter baumannii]HCW4582224.1 helix-turn-helix domain-containing protein [Acinetobacter baumannii]HCW4696586.1 helix-turn-helix domain-containing protein [Acinetobacter baumannii]